MFGIPDLHWTSVFRVLRASTRSVFFQSSLQINGDAGVQAGVRTFQDIDRPRHFADPTLPQSALLMNVSAAMRIEHSFLDG